MIRRLLILFVIAALAAAGVIAYAYAEAQRDPVIRRATLSFRAWPAHQPPIRVALLSDIHIGSAAMDGARLSRIADQVMAQHPDLIIIAGDFVLGHRLGNADRNEIDLSIGLARLHAPLGLIAVLGNHDHFTGVQAVERAVARGGGEMLVNTAIRRGPLTIYGLDDPFTGFSDPARARAVGGSFGGAQLWIGHSPDVIDQLPPGAVLLAGHTHCGQIVLPLVGSLGYVHQPRHICGLIHENGRTIVVTGGLGTSQLPLRLNAPPDFWMLTMGPEALH